MESLRIQSTDSSPNVDFDIVKRKLLISGDCRPEDTKEFFSPILEWLERFKNSLFQIYSKDLNNNDQVTIGFSFNLDYFNSTSAKYIIDIAKILRDIQQNEELDSFDLSVRWYYDELDDEMMESGEEIIDWTFLDMELVSI